MINKYTGISVVLFAVISIAASWMIYKKYTKNFYVSTNNSLESQQLIKDIEIKPEAFVSLEIMQNIVDKLSAEPLIIQENVSLALSPTTNKDKRPLVSIPTDKEKERRRAAAICRQARSFNVSMSYISADEKYAVVADKFVREGQVIDNKFKVIHIDAETIKVQKNGVKCDVKVSSANIAKL